MDEEEGYQLNGDGKGGSEASVLLLARTGLEEKLGG